MMQTLELTIENLEKRVKQSLVGVTPDQSLFSVRLKKNLYFCFDLFLKFDYLSHLKERKTLVQKNISESR